jgi:hypothetical protein
MSTLALDDKQKKLGDLAGDPAQAPSGPSGLSQASALVTPGSGGGVAGAGGSGGWTNVQAYLNANQSNNRTGDMLNSQVGSKINAAESDFGQKYGGFKSAVGSEVERTNLDESAVNDLYSKAAGSFSYGEKPQAYQESVGKLKAGVQEYKGPESFSYTLGDDVKGYGQSLGDDQGFSGLLQNLYKDTAKGQWTSGMNALQRQLDTSDENLHGVRQSLLSKYSGLDSGVAASAKDSSDLVGSSKTKVNESANRIKGQISGEHERGLGLWAARCGRKQLLGRIQKQRLSQFSHGVLERSHHAYRRKRKRPRSRRRLGKKESERRSRCPWRTGDRSGAGI